MNIFLLGNGFDLNHYFPTKYENFLHTLQFLISDYEPSMKTIGSVLGNKKLREKDRYIDVCYKQYGCAYDNIPLSENRIQILIDKAKKNMWFVYLMESLDEDLGWIDFEKEVGEVIRVFSVFLSKCNIDFDLREYFANAGDQYIVQRFNFFYKPFDEQSSGENKSMCASGSITGDFTYEYPKGSGYLKPSKDRIIEEMWKALDRFSGILKEYLCIFVEETIDTLVSQKLVPKNNLFYGADHIITFNYTHAFQKIYGKDTVKHIHGEVDAEIVLGINPDGSDELATIDTSFLRFKKYAQRVRYNTDLSYLGFIIGRQRLTKEFRRLVVVGHSLDRTDQDIIMELFDIAREICILYHSEKVVDLYIENLVSIYGKSGFDKLRTEKKLRFEQLHTCQLAID